MTPLDPALVDLAGAQHGAFASRQAHRLGITDRDLHDWVHRGELIRLRAGAFALAGAVEGTTPEQRYAVTVRGILLARRGRAWAGHHAALVLSGLPLVDCDLDLVHVSAFVRHRFRRSGVVTEPLPEAEPCLLVSGSPCVSTELAIVQTAAASGPRSGLAAMDAALRAGYVRPDGVAEALGRSGLGPRGHRRAGQVLALADASAESPGESVTRLLLHSLGIPTRSQVVIRDGGDVVARVDFLIDDRVVVEFDGAVKYEGARGRDALVREKRREDRLRSLGFEVVRLTWADLSRPAEVARRIRVARDRARRGFASSRSR